MKDSGVEWLRGIPKDWIILPSKQLFYESKQLRQSGDSQLTPSQKYGVVSQEEYMRLTDARIVLANAGLDKWRHVEPNDFIISLRSFQGGLEMSEIPGCVTWHYIVLRPRRGLVSHYYKYLFKTKQYIAALQQTCHFIRDGQDLRYSNFIQVPIPYPPIDDQQRVADYLDERCASIDEVRKTITDEIEALRRLRKASIHRAVTKGLDGDAPKRDSGVKWIGAIPIGWRIQRLKHFVRLKTAKSTETKNYIGLENVESFTGKCIGDQLNPESTAIRFSEGDVLFGKLRPYLAKVYLAQEAGCCSSEFLVMQPVLLESRYLEYSLLNPAFIDFVNSSTYGAKMPRANWSFIGNAPIPHPPLPEQRRIADYLDERCAAIDSVIDIRTRQLERLEDYRRALIFAYVTGKKEVPSHE